MNITTTSRRKLLAMAKKQLGPVEGDALKQLVLTVHNPPWGERFLADNMASATAYEHPRLDDLTTTILRDLVRYSTKTEGGRR